MVIPKGFRVSSHSANTANASLLIGVISIIRSYYVAKVQNILENKKDFSKKTENKWGFIWKISEKFLSLQRQNISFGYPGRIPRGVRLYRYCPF